MPSQGSSDYLSAKAASSVDSFESFPTIPSLYSSAEEGSGPYRTASEPLTEYTTIEVCPSEKSTEYMTVEVCPSEPEEIPDEIPSAQSTPKQRSRSELESEERSLSDEKSVSEEKSLSDEKSLPEEKSLPSLPVSISSLSTVSDVLPENIPLPPSVPGSISISSEPSLLSSLQMSKTSPVDIPTPSSICFSTSEISSSLPSSSSSSFPSSVSPEVLPTISQATVTSRNKLVSYDSSLLEPSPSMMSMALPDGPDNSFETSFLRPSASTSSPNRMSTIPESASVMTSARPRSYPSLYPVPPPAFSTSTASVLPPPSSSLVSEPQPAASLKTPTDISLSASVSPVPVVIHLLSIRISGPPPAPVQAREGFHLNEIVTLLMIFISHLIKDNGIFLRDPDVSKASPIPYDPKSLTSEISQRAKEDLQKLQQALLKELDNTPVSQPVYSPPDFQDSHGTFFSPWEQSVVNAQDRLRDNLSSYHQRDTNDTVDIPENISIHEGHILTGFSQFEISLQQSDAQSRASLVQDIGSSYMSEPSWSTVLAKLLETRDLLLPVKEDPVSIGKEPAASKPSVELATEEEHHQFNGEIHLTSMLQSAGYIKHGPRAPEQGATKPLKNILTENSRMARYFALGFTRKHKNVTIGFGSIIQHPLKKIPLFAVYTSSNPDNPWVQQSTHIQGDEPPSGDYGRYMNRVFVSQPRRRDEKKQWEAESIIARDFVPTVTICEGHVKVVNHPVHTKEPNSGSSSNLAAASSMDRLEKHVTETSRKGAKTGKVASVRPPLTSVSRSYKTAPTKVVTGVGLEDNKHGKPQWFNNPARWPFLLDHQFFDLVAFRVNRVLEAAPDKSPSHVKLMAYAMDVDYLQFYATGNKMLEKLEANGHRYVAMNLKYCKIGFAPHQNNFKSATDQAFGRLLQDFFAQYPATIASLKALQAHPALAEYWSKTDILPYLPLVSEAFPSSRCGQREPMSTFSFELPVETAAVLDLCDRIEKAAKAYGHQSTPVEKEEFKRLSRKIYTDEISVIFNDIFQWLLCLMWITTLLAQPLAARYDPDSPDSLVTEDHLHLNFITALKAYELASQMFKSHLMECFINDQSSIIGSLTELVTMQMKEKKASAKHKSKLEQKLDTAIVNINKIRTELVQDGLSGNSSSLYAQNPDLMQTLLSPTFTQYLEKLTSEGEQLTGTLITLGSIPFRPPSHHESADARWRKSHFTAGSLMYYGYLQYPTGFQPTHLVLNHLIKSSQKSQPNFELGFFVLEQPWDCGKMEGPAEVIGRLCSDIISSQVTTVKNSMKVSDDIEKVKSGELKAMKADKQEQQQFWLRLATVYNSTKEDVFSSPHYRIFPGSSHAEALVLLTAILQGIYHPVPWQTKDWDWLESKRKDSDPNNFLHYSAFEDGLGVSRLCCPLCTEIFRALGFKVPGSHNRIFPAAMPGDTPKPVFDTVRTYFQGLIRDAVFCLQHQMKRSDSPESFSNGDYLSTASYSSEDNLAHVTSEGLLSPPDAPPQEVGILLHNMWSMGHSDSDIISGDLEDESGYKSGYKSGYHTANESYD
ncbi:hypothetical protein C8J56DRAFT_1131655 [Mycena floridula]|nr:hypothetical protein C8J56DRAFT_1131655 [Mycena floridula]